MPLLYTKAPVKAAERVVYQQRSSGKGTYDTLSNQECHSPAECVTFVTYVFVTNITNITDITDITLVTLVSQW
jgi:hypothetical protein